MGDGSGTRVPTRLIARIVSEVQQGMLATLTPRLSAVAGKQLQFGSAILALILLRNHPRFRAAGTGVSAPAAVAEPVPMSVNAAAATLHRPFETMRRHALALRGTGLLDENARALAISEAFMANEACEALLLALHDWIVSLAEDLAAIGVPLPVGRLDLPYRPDVTIAVAIDLGLTPFEFLAGRYVHWIDLVLVNAVVTASTRHWTYDPEISWRYAWPETPPPRELRLPVSLPRVAQAHGLTLSTVNRHARAAIESGMLMRVPGGVLASEAFLEGETIVKGGTAAAGRTLQALSRLVPGGFRFDSPATCYAVGRPNRLDYAPPSSSAAARQAGSFLRRSISIAVRPSPSGISPRAP